jgi:hypothetical protein
VVVSFRRNVEAQVRFLVMLSLLVHAEVTVRLADALGDVAVARPPGGTRRHSRSLDTAAAAAARLSSSAVAALALLLFVLAVGHWIWRSERALALPLVCDPDARRRALEPGEPLLGGPDLPSLADLANCQAPVRETRLVTLGWPLRQPQNERPKSR